MGIQLAQRAGCCIPAVGKRHEPCFIPFLIQGDEAFSGHIHFTSHFQVGRCVFNVKRNGVNGFDVGRHIFPYSAVASGKSLNQAAIFVNKIHGKAINFKFRNIFHGVYTKAFLHPAVKIPKFIGTESIGQAQHGLAETDFSKIVGCFAPYPLGRRIGSHQFWIFLFQIHQLTIEVVKFIIRNFRSIFHIVQVAVMADFLPEFLHLFPDFFSCHRNASILPS